MTRLEELVRALRDEIDAAEHAMLTRNKGGQHAGVGRPLERVNPSAMRELKWWSEALREQLPKVTE